MRDIGLSSSSWTFLDLASLIMAALAIFLFRKAALQERFLVQAGWLAGAVLAGFMGVTLVGGLSLAQWVILALAAFFWHAFLLEPPPSRYYLRPLYHTGYWYLIVLCVLGKTWMVSLLIAGLYLAGYLAIKFLIRDYERACVSGAAVPQEQEISGMPR